VTERLRWEIEFQTKGYEVEQKLARGAPPPQWWLDEPVPDDATRFIVEAFWILSTERHVGMALGHIPDSFLVAYAERKGVTPAMMVAFRAAIRAADACYLDWAARRRERAEKKANPSG
jgi:hypothetical protein